MLLNGKAYSIVTDQLGTPTEAYNDEGEEVWSRKLDMNGNILEENYDQYAPYSEQIWIPFLFQGQYYDHETELAYNRFRYYSPHTGNYISQDPIRLSGNNPTLYAYTHDSNWWIDPLGLKCFNATKKNFWKAEANPHKYSSDNLSRVSDGKPPRMTVEVFDKKTGMTTTKDVSIELHHTYIPQRNGGSVVNEAWSLTPATPWAHTSMDCHRHTGDVLIRIIRGTNSWIK